MCRKMTLLSALLLAPLCLAQVPTTHISTSAPSMPVGGRPDATVLTSTTPARGSRTRRAAGGQGDCASDAERVCTEDENKPGMRAACLRKHFTDLSAGCQDSHPDWRPSVEAAGIAKASWKELAPEWRMNCPVEAQGACADRQGSEAAWWACLDARWKTVSPGCRTYARTHDAWARRCPGEFDDLCAGVEPEKATACMQSRRKQLSKSCAAFADELKRMRTRTATPKPKPASPKPGAPRP